MFENEETVEIHTTESEGEEAAVCAALDEEGIQYMIQPLQVTFEGLFPDVQGHSQISVLQHDVERAMQKIQSVLERFRVPENEGESSES